MTGLNADEIAHTLNLYWADQPDMRPVNWNEFLSYRWTDRHGLVTALVVDKSLRATRLSPYESVERYHYEKVLTQRYWRRRAVMIYSQYPLASYTEPVGQSDMNGGIVGPDPVDPSGEHIYL